MTRFMPSYTIMTPKGGLEKLGGLLTAGGIALWIAHKVLSPCPSKRKSTLNAPPQAAFALPIFGHLFYLLLDSSRFLDWCASHYGEVFDLKVLWKTITVVNSQSAVEAMKADSSQLSMEQGTMKDLFHMHYVMSSAIFDLSFRVTPILARKRLSRSAMDVYAASISENARVFFDALPCTSSVPRSDHFFQRLITVIGMPSLVGEELASDPLVADSFATVNMDTVSRTCVFLLIPSGLHLLFRKYYLQPALLWHQRIAQERILPIVRELRNAPGRQQHLLQDLVDYRKKDGTAFTVEEITEGVKMIAFAATFGSHNILTAAVCLLVARPDLQAKLRNELDRVLSLSGRPKEDALSLEAINQMTFLNRFVREVIRQNADKLGTFRAVMQDVFTFSNGYQIPKGRKVATMNRHMNFGLNVNNSDVRYIDPETVAHRDACSPSRQYTSFGLGQHACPGRYYAVLLIKVILISMVRRYEILSGNGRVPKPFQYVAGSISIPSSAPLLLVRRRL